MLLENLKKIQFHSSEPEYFSPLPFPDLEPLSYSEMDKITKAFATNKAASFDGVSDIMFHKDWIFKTNVVFKDLWQTLAKYDEINQLHFDTRIVPLNKAHPQIPTAEECRPIAIASPLVRILEGRVKEKLDNYMISRMHRSQIGFVKHNGITVNQFRLIERVRKRTETIGTNLHAWAFPRFFNCV